MKTATFQRFTWRGYTVECSGWQDGGDVEWEELTVKDDNGEPLDHLTLLLEAEGRNYMTELADKFIEGCMSDYYDKKDGTYWSSCD